MRGIPTVAFLVAMPVSLAILSGCQSPRPTGYAEFERPLVCTVSRSEANGRSPAELCAEVACRVSIAVGLDMQGDPARAIEGWLMHSETYFGPRVVLFTDRAVELVAVQPEGSPGETSISLRFPWATDRSTWLDGDRWRHLGDVSGSLVAAWPEIVRATTTGAPFGDRLREETMRQPYGFLNLGRCGTGYDEFRTEEFAAAR